MENIFYVYVHRKPNGEVFYVGKGKAVRAWVKAKRSKYWRAVVAKYGYVVQIVDKELPESIAFELEEFLIDYYKIKSDGGCLVNLTRGGEGSSGRTPSSTTKLKMSVSGKIAADKRPYDTNTYTFVNCKTLEEFTGTRREFKDVKGINTTSLFTVRTDHSVYNWCLKENLENAINAYTDFNVYTFTSIHNEQLRVTRQEFKEKTGICPNNLFISTGRYSSISGWCLGDNPDKISLCSKHDIVHRFENKEGVIIQATRTDFKQQTGIDTESLFGKRKNNSIRGWCLEGNADKIRAQSPPNEIYAFQNIDGSVIKATRISFEFQTGVNPRSLFLVGKKKATITRTGWSLLPTNT